MKKLEWIFVIAAICATIYFTYSYLNPKEKFKPWDLVTENAAIVYKNQSIVATWNKLVGSDIWNDISKVKEVNQLNKNLQLLDTLSGGAGQLASFFHNKKIIISGHVTSQYNYGTTYIVPLKENEKIVLLNTLRDAQKKWNFVKSKRTYKDHIIYELKLGTKKVSYIIYKNTLVLSTYAFLIEDVVRNIESKFKNNFLKKNLIPSSKSNFVINDGSIYISGEEIVSFLNSFLSIKDEKSKNAMVAKTTLFDFNINSEGVFADGFSFDSDKKSLTSTFKGQKIIEFKLMDLIPQNTATIEHYGVSDVNKWYTNWTVFQNEKSIDNIKGREFVSFIKNELIHITLQSADKNHSKKIFIAELSDKVGMYDYLDNIARKKNKKTSDSLYLELYEGNKIKMVDDEPILKKYFGSSFKGFNSTYYLIYENYLVIANTAQTLREWVSYIKNDFTWSKSVRINNFFKNALSESNYTYATNLDYSWSLHYDNLHETNKSWVTENAESIKKINFLIFQISNLDNKYYTNLHLNYASISKRENLDIDTIQLTNGILNKPKITKNHKTNAWEILIQDTLYNLMLINEVGKTLWKDSLGLITKKDIYQLDYYKNNKLQYLIHTDSSLFLIDRKGNFVDNYPIKMDYKIKKIYLIDYDNTKEYRILISDYFGNLRMYDKRGVALEGWKPNIFNANFSDHIFHIRVREKDRILIPLKNGIVHLNNRRAQEVDGFPLDLGINITNPFFARKGKKIDDTQFTTLSESGLVVHFTMKGKILSKNQLPKNSNTTKFKLLIEKQGKNYVFIQNDRNKISLISPNGDFIFDKNLSSSSKPSVQYYNFGPNRQLYVIKDGHSIYLYNQHGKLLTNAPLVSEFLPSVVYLSSEGVCKLYLINENKVEINKIQL